MKEIVIVSKGNNAVAYGEGVEIKKTSTTGVSANLLALNEVLKTVVPTEAGETHRVFLMDLVQGINSGYAIDYVKSGKQMNGEPLNEVDLAGYKEFYELYKDRLLNVRFNLVSYIPKMKDNKVQMNLRSKAYAILNSMPVATATTVVAQPSPVIKKLEEMMVQALEECDFDKYDKLEARLNSLKAQGGAVVTTTTQASTNTHAPSFDVKEGSLDDLDFSAGTTSAGETLAKDEDDKEEYGPIVFDTESSSTPTWDDTQA